MSLYAALAFLACLALILVSSAGFTYEVSGGGGEKRWYHLPGLTGLEKKGVRVLLSSDQGREISNLADTFTLVWCTVWNDDANRFGRAYLLDRWADGERAGKPFKLITTPSGLGLTHKDMKDLGRWGQNFSL